MKITKTGVTRLIAIVGSVLAAVMTLLVHRNVIDSGLASDISVVWAALAAGWGGNTVATALQARAAAKATARALHSLERAGRNASTASSVLRAAAAAAQPARRFGKLPAVPIEKCARLDKHLPATLPAPPATLNWTDKLAVAWGMMLNDRLGDCTCAAVGHAIQLLTALASKLTVTLPDSTILALYSAISGYDPATGANDRGAVEADVLAYWRSQGVAGHKLTAFGRVAVSNLTAVKQTIALFGFAYIGTAVPQAWKSAPAVWDVSESPIVGGHAVILVGWDDTGFWLVSWGQVFKMTYAAFSAYVDEVWGVVSPDWIEQDAKSPSGLDVAALTADLDALEQVSA